MTLVFQTILPVAILIGFGFVLGKRRFFDRIATDALVRFSVRIVVPVAIFLQTIGTPFAQLSDPKYVAVLTIAFIGMYAVGLVGTMALGNGWRDSIVAAACVSYPNMALLGLPIYTGIVGSHFAAMNVAIGNIITSLTIVPLTLAALASIGPTVERKQSIMGFVWGALRPPLVWLPLLGVILPQLGISHLPGVLGNTLKPVAQANEALGLICLGLILSQQAFRFDRFVAVDVLLKVAVMPVAVIGLTSVFAIGGNARLALILVGVTPTASSMATIAAGYRADSSHASATILLTTLLSLIAFPVVQMAFS